MLEIEIQSEREKVRRRKGGLGRDCVCERERERREIERGILIVRETVTSSVILNNRKQDKTGKKLSKHLSIPYKIHLQNWSFKRTSSACSPENAEAYSPPYPVATPALISFHIFH